jgi:hypothetical protein
MVDNAQNHWVSGLHPSSEVVNTRRHKVNWICLGLRIGGIKHSFWSLRKKSVSKGPNKVGVSLPSPEDGKISNFRNFVFSSYLEYLKMDKHIINVMETLNPPL